MAKVDWINWKTDPSEIINPNKIVENISSIFNDYNCYMNSVVYEGISHEIEKGGLDKMSLNLLGKSPANENAIEILGNITEIKDIIHDLQEKELKSAEEQKNIEKEQLIRAIEEKILEEENKLNNTISLKERVQVNNNLISIEEIDNVIDITNSRIEKLKERLEAARAI